MRQLLILLLVLARDLFQFVSLGQVRLVFAAQLLRELIPAHLVVVLR